VSSVSVNTTGRMAGAARRKCRSCCKKNHKKWFILKFNCFFFNKWCFIQKNIIRNHF
jgi:hypothetical protein